MHILNKLTLINLRKNKKRTIVTIIGILLSTALMCGFGLLISSFRDLSIREAITYSGDYYLQVAGYPKDQLSLIEQNKDVSFYYEESVMGFFVLKSNTVQDNVYNTYGRIIHADTNYLQDLKLKEGVLPKNHSEIVVSEKALSYLNKKVGDMVSVTFGDLQDENEAIVRRSLYNYLDDTLKLVDTSTLEYKIVGVIENGQIPREDWNDTAYLFTTGDSSLTTANLFIKSKNAKNITKVADEIKNGIKDPADQMEFVYNDSLLAMYGVSRYNNVMGTMTGLMIVILALVSLGCMIVIYNSFAISVMERKKQFGLFSSIGATAKQLRKTVFFEAFFVGTIGIVLGILGSFIGIGILIQVMNHLLNSFSTNLNLSVYPLFLIIPIIFMILVVLFSAYMPAKRASKVSPIEAIRQNDDIKIDKKKIKTSKITRKLFGVEGEIASKNIKRNKKKYRITIISLVTSIVLFISFSSILNYVFVNVNDYLYYTDYDLAFSYYQSSDDDGKEKEQAHQALQTVLNHKSVTNSIVFKRTYSFYTPSMNQNYTKAYQDKLKQLEAAGYSVFEQQDYRKLNELYTRFDIVVVEDSNFKKLQDQYHLNGNQPIFLDTFKNYQTQNGNRKLIVDRVVKERKNAIALCDMASVVTNEDYDHLNLDKINCSKTSLKNIAYISDVPFGFMSFAMGDALSIFVSESMMTEIQKNLYPNDAIDGIYHTTGKADRFQSYFEVNDYDEIDEYLTEVINHDIFHSYYYQNVKSELQQTNNMVLVIKILFYGFIGLVTLIGVTSVFNTLNTSIALRQKEFAMLRSMGLTPKGLNKMIIFESIFFGVKSLVIGLTIALVVNVLVHNIMSNMVSSGVIIPFGSIGVAIVAVFIIVLMTMAYATSKIRHDNILEAIRDENI